MTDINDQNPVFLQTDYTFRVDEGMADAYVGTVQVRSLNTVINKLKIFAPTLINVLIITKNN